MTQCVGERKWCSKVADLTTAPDANSDQVLLLVALLSTTALTVAPASFVDLLPTGGKVIAGSATICQSDADMTVTLGAGKVIINWRDFSIGKNNSVKFIQPGRTLQRCSASMAPRFYPLPTS
ncbi:hypothetical protein [uncultured Cohaesibacter sp.]|uniref:hypothetical protein n=1 Tax=uncultured Cohaesibacter sp. TaxID=1002546 RepID=UPI0037487DAC